MISSFLKSKAGFWSLIILVTGVIGIIAYQVYKANKDVTDAASSIENGGIGKALVSNVSEIYNGAWSWVKSLWTSAPDTAGTTAITPSQN